MSQPSPKKQPDVQNTIPVTQTIMPNTQPGFNIPIMDMTTGNSDEPFVMAKLPLKLYNQFIQSTLNQQQQKTQVKGSWTEEEDKLLLQYVQKYGPKRWTFIASHLAGRNGKQCRERYLNHLDPSINKSDWTVQEDLIIYEMHNKVGNHWAKIAKKLPGRTANAIKNRWNSTLRRRTENFQNQCPVSQELFNTTNFIVSPKKPPSKKRKIDEIKDESQENGQQKKKSLDQVKKPPMLDMNLIPQPETSITLETDEKMYNPFTDQLTPSIKQDETKTPSLTVENEQGQKQLLSPHFTSKCGLNLEDLTNNSLLCGIWSPKDGLDDPSVLLISPKNEQSAALLRELLDAKTPREKDNTDESK